MNKKIVLNFDDFTSDNNKLDLIHKLKKAIPNLKLTLFAIPVGMPPDFLHEVSHIGWIEMAMHGVDHSLNEFGMYDKETAIRRIKKGEGITEHLLVKGFKAPRWRISKGTLEALKELGYWVATHPWASKDLAFPPGMRSYRWNVTASMAFPAEGDLFVHGHIQNVESENIAYRNGLEQNFDKLLKLEGDFKFVSEVVE